MKKKVDANNYLVEKEITEEINYHKNSKIKTMENSNQIKTEKELNEKSRNDKKKYAEENKFDGFRKEKPITSEYYFCDFNLFLWINCFDQFLHNSFVHSHNLLVFSSDDFIYLFDVQFIAQKLQNVNGEEI